MITQEHTYALAVENLRNFKGSLLGVCNKLKSKLHTLGFIASIPIDLGIEFYTTFFNLYEIHCLNVFLFILIVLIIIKFRSLTVISQMVDIIYIYFVAGMFLICFFKPCTFMFVLTIWWFPTLWLICYIYKSLKIKDPFGPLEFLAIETQKPHEAFSIRKFAKIYLDIRNTRRANNIKGYFILDLYAFGISVLGILLKIPFLLFAILVLTPPVYMPVAYCIVFGFVTGILVLTQDKRFVCLLNQHLYPNFLEEVGFGSIAHIVTKFFTISFFGVLLSQLHFLIKIH